MPPLDTFLDRLSAAGWSYGITTYVDEDGQKWTMIDAHKAGDAKVWRWKTGSDEALIEAMIK